MINVKKLSLILLLIIAALIFFSCSENETVSGKPVITFSHFWSEPYQKVIIDSLVSRFERENNCEVEISLLSWNEGKAKLFTAFNAGTAPDVLELGSDWVAQFSSSGVLMEIRPDTANLGGFIEMSHSPCFWDGKIYGIPWIVNSRVLFYNKDLLADAGADTAAPRTMYEMLNASAAINEKGNAAGFGANGPDAHRLYKKIVNMFWTYGGEIIDSAGNPAIYSPENVRALDMYAALARNGRVDTQQKLDKDFTLGKLGLWVSGGWLVEKIRNENPGLNYGIAKVPGVMAEDMAGPRLSPGISFAGGEYLAVNSGSKSKGLALKLVKYLTSGENALEFCEQITEAGFPADKEFYSSERLISDPARAVFAEQLEYSRMTPVHPKWLEIEKVIEDAAVSVLYGKSYSRDALMEAEELVLDILK